MTASFARISRSNELEFVPLTCERNDGGVIVPVREIAGNIRFNTDFSDDTTCIAKLFTRRNGAAVYSTREISAGGSEKLAVMELNENPLLAELSDDEVAAVLNNELLQMYKCLNRVFDSSFTGDPALEIGDYVRLRGGAIDTDRGYATGMITSQIWRYRGQHTIKCSMPSSLSAVEESAVAAYSAETSTESRQRTQPKSQTEKQIDELRKQLSQSGGDGMLHDVNGSAACAYLSKDKDSDITQITAQGVDGDKQLSLMWSQKLKYLGLSITDANGMQGCAIEIEYGSIKISDGSGTNIYVGADHGGGSLDINGGGIHITGGSGGFNFQAGSNMLSFTGDAIYVNGKKVLLEG